MRKMGAIKISGLVIVLFVVLGLIGGSLSGFIISEIGMSPVSEITIAEETISDTTPVTDENIADIGDSTQTNIPSSGGSSGDLTPDISNDISEIFNSDIFNDLNFEDIGEPVKVPSCASAWECSKWESCQNGLQHRGCEDINKCELPTNSPVKTISCTLEEFCEESWECSWSECSADVSHSNPFNCVDKNNCVTDYEMPQSQSCNTLEICSPDFLCSDWEDCEVDYGFNSFDTNLDGLLMGVQYRTCFDSNLCAESTKDSRSCFLEKDIEILLEDECQSTQIVLSDLLSGKIVARIDSDKFEITLGDGGDTEIELCAHCLNGKFDPEKGEEGIDWGGPCPDYEVKYSPVVFEEKPFFERVSSIGYSSIEKIDFIRTLIDWFRNVF